MEFNLEGIKDDEIKIGEYVRTKEGLVGVLINIVNDEYIIQTIKDDPICTWNAFRDSIVKHSDKKIGIVESCDYVNGIEVIHVVSTCYRTGEKELVLEMVSDAGTGYANEIFDEHIKNIVTNEMFNSVMYEY